MSDKKAARSVGDMDLDLDDMVIQQREFDNAGSLYLPEKLNLINLEQFIKEFNNMDDDEVRAAIISNAVTRSQDRKYQWSILQLKALLYVRQYQNIFQPCNIWKFSLKMIK